MGPIEGLWAALVMVFVLLGIIRGFLKELGLTTVMIVWLFGMDQMIPRVEGFIVDQSRVPGSFVTRLGLNEQTMATPLWLIFTLITVLVVFIAYQGETLAFEGTPPKGAMGVIYGIAVGLVNGYLVCGTLWWILNRYHYPIQATGMFVPFNPATGQVLTDAANNIVNVLKLLPPDLLGQGADQATSLGLLPLLVVAMVLLRVIR